MAVKVKYYSDRDPETMFDSKKDADEYDRKLEAIEDLAEVLVEATSQANIAMERDQAYVLSEKLLTGHKEQLISILTGKKLRKT